MKLLSFRRFSWGAEMLDSKFLKKERERKKERKSRKRKKRNLRLFLFRKVEKGKDEKIFTE